MTQKTASIELIREISVDTDMIIDQVTTALEGGSNYWYLLKEMPGISEDKSIPLSERIANAVLFDQAEIPVYDIQDEDELLGKLTLSGIEKALKEMPINVFMEIITEAGDAETADVFLQFAVMGEITFS